MATDRPNIPNPDLGPFEAENGDRCDHVTAIFLDNVTRPRLAAAGGIGAHEAMAHLRGFALCAMWDWARRSEPGNQAQINERSHCAPATGRHPGRHGPEGMAQSHRDAT